MRILCPASFAELRAMLRKAVLELSGPVALPLSARRRGRISGLPSGTGHGFA